ncbi:hypothetical protein PO909_018761 [Leuciscus waleckii]
MKLLFQYLLLVVMSALQKCQTTEEYILNDFAGFYDMESGYIPDKDLSVPKITVYRQVEDREHVIVLCESDMTSNMFFESSTLSVESELKYTMKRLTSSLFSDSCVFLVTVSPPASFTCKREIHSNGESKNLSSQTYTYVLDNHEEGVSLFYICFSSFIAVGLFIMTVAVIVTTIRSKAKDSIINPTTTVTDNDYMDA